MNRILLASIAVLGMVGTAAAAGAGDGTPGLYGDNYSADVLQATNGDRAWGYSWEYRGAAQPGLNTHAMSRTAPARNGPGYSTDRMVRTQQHRPSQWQSYSGG